MRLLRTRELPRAGERYAEQTFTYPYVGATADGQLPAGYRHVMHTAPLGRGDQVFAAAGQALTSWGMPRRAGFTVPTTAPRAREGVTSVMTIGVAGVGLVVPCRVVWAVDDQDRCGFAYGTLPDHPERGEESFVVERRDDEVVLLIRAFSVPADPLLRAVAPVAALLQDAMTRRYGRSLRLLART